MKPSSPTISVLMPVYNGERYLDSAIRSIRAQTFSDLELIVVNDGSTDGSFSIMRRHMDEDERVIVLDQPNGGITAALNAGIAECRGEFIARMDGDDLAYPQRLDQQFAWMRANPDALAVGCQTRTIDEQGNELSRPQRPLTSDAIELYCLQKSAAAISHPSLFIRAQTLRDIGGYSDLYRYTEDLDLYLRLAERGRLGNLEQVLLDYRVHGNMTSSPYNLQQTLSGIQAVRDACERRKLNARPFLAGRLHKASWQSTDLNQPMAGVRYALQSLFAAPTQWRSFKIVMRSLIRGYVVPKRVDTV